MIDPLDLDSDHSDFDFTEQVQFCPEISCEDDLASLKRSLSDIQSLARRLTRSKVDSSDALYATTLKLQDLLEYTIDKVEPYISSSTFISFPLPLEDPTLWSSCGHDTRNIALAISSAGASRNYTALHIISSAYEILHNAGRLAALRKDAYGLLEDDLTRVEEKGHAHEYTAQIAKRNAKLASSGGQDVIIGGSKMTPSEQVYRWKREMQNERDLVAKLETVTTALQNTLEWLRWAETA